VLTLQELPIIYSKIIAVNFFRLPILVGKQIVDAMRDKASHASYGTMAELESSLRLSFLRLSFILSFSAFSYRCLLPFPRILCLRCAALSFPSLSDIRGFEYQQALAPVSLSSSGKAGPFASNASALRTDKDPALPKDARQTTTRRLAYATRCVSWP
jgi:hypothetical protein